MRKKLFFTLDQAQKALPQLKPIFKQLMKLHRAISMIDSIELEFEDYHYENNLIGININKKYHRLSYEFYQALEDLERFGCIVKDLDVGLLDFYSKHDGREIVLCWMLGEDNIKYWHESDDGYANRQPISLLKEKKINSRT